MQDLNILDKHSASLFSSTKLHPFIDDNSTSFSVISRQIYLDDNRIPYQEEDFFKRNKASSIELASFPEYERRFSMQESFRKDISIFPSSLELASFPENKINTPEIETKNSSQNKENHDIEKYLKENITPKFLYLVREEDFEFGFTPESEKLIREHLEIHALATRNWLSEIFITYFKDEIVLVGLLRIMAHFQEKDIFPQGQIMAIAALSHSSDEIKELGIRAFESWCSAESLDILKNLDIKTTWLKEYADQVIIDIEKHLCPS